VTCDGTLSQQKSITQIVIQRRELTGAGFGMDGRDGLDLEIQWIVDPLNWFLAAS